MSFKNKVKMVMRSENEKKVHNTDNDVDIIFGGPSAAEFTRNFVLFNPSNCIVPIRGTDARQFTGD